MMSTLNGDSHSQDRRVDGLKRPRLLFICLVAALVTVVVMHFLSNWQQHRAFVNEINRFRDLGEMAANMVAERGPAIEIRDADRPFIRSFDDLFNYVTSKRPDIVAARDAENPFPGLLPKGNYQRANTPATSSEDLLIWSMSTHQRPMGTVKMRLTACGEVKTLAD